MLLYTNVWYATVFHIKGRYAIVYQELVCYFIARTGVHTKGWCIVNRKK